jgi:serine/threonine-protein kinase
MGVNAMASGAESKERAEGICDRFEAQWQAGQRPSIEAWLEGSGPSLLRELLYIELSHRRRLGETPSPGEYCTRFPQAAQLVEEVFNGPHASCTETAMASALVGRSVSHFKILGHLGSGGMGNVYLAEDTRLGRRVAVKFLPPEFSRDSESVRRLEREARAASALNHPHICTIYDMGEFDGQPFLVMELLEGTTLKERISGRPLKTREILELGRQIADALEAAHSQGIVHRDLKPTNLFVSDGGSAKILDFGLAKLIPPSPPLHSTDPFALTRSKGHDEELTSPGMVVGTRAYMSPEQARGEPVDMATDIWSFGCVLYEMATGTTAFGGSSAQEILVKILDREPDWEALPKSTPMALRRLIRRCLQKERRDRLRDIGDARIELAELAGASDETLAAAEVGVGRRPTWLVAAAAGACLLLAGALFAVFSRSPSPDPGTLADVERNPPSKDSRATLGDHRVTRFTVNAPEGKSFYPALNPHLALSPDGTRLAFTSEPGPVFVRRLDILESQPLEASSDWDFGGGPVFSPDGKSLSFIQGNAIYSWKRPFFKAALSGGAAVPLAAYDMFHSGDWGTDGYIYWTCHYPGGIVRVRDSGGEIKPVTKLDVEHGELSHRFAKLLPGGQALIYTVAFKDMDRNSFDDARIDLWDLRSGARKTLIHGGMAPVYSPSGHIVYARRGKLFAVPFDLDTLKVTGTPFEALDGVMMSRNTGATQFCLSDRGDLAYVPGADEGGRRTLVWVDRSGNAESLELPDGPASYLYPRISPDGEHLAYEIEGPTHDYYVYHFETGVRTKMSTDGLSHAPVWSPDGKRLAFRSWRSGRGMTMWCGPVDRSEDEVCLDPHGTRQSATSFSPDGRFIAFDQHDAENRGDVWIVAVDGIAAPQPVAHSKYGEGSAKFSPDGRWLAYSSDESNRAEVYVQAFPLPGPTKQISVAGGTDPVWRRSGGEPGELYYRQGTKMMAVTYTVSASGEFMASAPKQLWEGDYSHGVATSCGMPTVSSANYDVSPDGERFLMVRDDDNVSHDKHVTWPQAFGRQIVVVLNWAEELKAIEAALPD